MWTWTQECSITIGPITCGTLHFGSKTLTFVNPIPALLTGSAKVIDQARSWLAGAFKKIGTGCAALPEGTTTFGAPGPNSTVTDLTYTVDGPNAPYSYQT